MRALYIILPILCILAIAYRYYSAFIAARIMSLDDSRMTPAHVRNDGHNYHPTHRLVLFGHHFAAITGAGPLIGPVLAAQFGYAPGLIWLVAGVCLAGAVHDFIILWASTRRGGGSLAEIARAEIGPVAGVTAAIAILFIIVIALAGLGLAVVNALAGERLGHVHDRRLDSARAVHGPLHVPVPEGPDRRGHGRSAWLACSSRWSSASRSRRPLSAHWFHLIREQLIVAMAAYGFIASVLPVWMLLCPRDYLSSFMKIGTIAFLVLAVVDREPRAEDAGVQPVRRRRRPDHPGTALPVRLHHHRVRRDLRIPRAHRVGHHAEDDRSRIGHPPDRLRRDARSKAWSASSRCIAATAMFPGDYFAINTPPAVFANLGIPMVNLPDLQLAVGETVAGRPGGAVSLAVGIAQIFSGLPGMRGLMDYWYHFAIMFEALFILTTIDTGTRVARFLVQEFLGQFYAPMARQEWLPGSVVSTLLVVASLVVLHLDRQHQHDLADVRHRQPAARVGGARRRHDDHHQHGQGAVRLGDADAAVVRLGDDADGRGA